MNSSTYRQHRSVSPTLGTAGGRAGIRVSGAAFHNLLMSFKLWTDAGQRPRTASAPYRWAMTAYLRSVTWRGQTSRSPYQSQFMRSMTGQVKTGSVLVRGLAFSCTGVGIRLTQSQNVSAHNPAAA